MRNFLALAAGAAAILTAAPAMAQTATDDAPFQGGYIAGTVGYDWGDGGKNSRIEFDRNLDGTYGDTVTTAANADAFSPGFCNGAARGNAPAAGCRKDKDGVGYSVRAGYDWQTPGSSIVFGGVLEIGKTEIRDSVSAFSTTPASYTMTREVDYLAAARARVGFASNATLFYGTGGVAYGNIDNSFATTNTANAFSQRGKDDAWGFQLGAGVEHKLGRNFSLGVEYLYTQLKDDNYRVRAGNSGTTPATNPFLLGSTSGTDFRRSDDKFKFGAVRAVAAYRF